MINRSRPVLDRSRDVPLSSPTPLASARRSVPGRDLPFHIPSSSPDGDARARVKHLSVRSFQMMNFSWASVLLVAVLPLTANAIRCYKCDASQECKTISNGGSSKNYYHASENVEIIDCEYYCWKSISLGKRNDVDDEASTTPFALHFRQRLPRMRQEALQRVTRHGNILEQRVLRRRLLQWQRHASPLAATRRRNCITRALPTSLLETCRCCLYAYIQQNRLR